MRRAILLILLILPFLGADAREPDPKFKPDPALGTYLTRAAVSDGRLWALSLDGALVSFGLADNKRHVWFRKNVITLDKHDGRLFVLTRAEGRYDLLEWKKDAFARAASLALPTKPDWLLLAWQGDQPLVVTPNAIWRRDGRQWQMLRTEVLSPNIDLPHRPPVAAAAAASGRFLYLGYSNGEWGGGMARIDLESGAVLTSMDAYRDSGKTDTVVADGDINAIIPDPANPDCVIAADGLIHFFASGRLLRVCTDHVSIAYSRPTGENKGDTEAFFGVAPAKDGYWAISSNAIYHFGSAPEPDRVPLAGLGYWNGLWVGREIPGIVIVYSEISRQLAVNGGMALLAPLD
ncbi:MAG: hypothetical protein JSR60_11900 [Proteobacteria bacterium]|nr:hypothetical protein [Pseudomonadota bacterium]